MRSRPATSRSMSGPPKRKCQSRGFFRISSQGPMPGTGASMRAKRRTRLGYCAANAYPTMLPMSWVTRSARSIFNASRTPATSAACVFLSKPPAGLEDRPSPRRSGTTTVRSRARSAAIGAHMSPVSPYPCSRTTAGPLPPERTWIEVPFVAMSCVRNPAGNVKLSKAISGQFIRLAASDDTVRGHRRSEKNSLTSRARASGCSRAAKWPPFSITLQRRMSA